MLKFHPRALDAYTILRLLVNYVQVTIQCLRCLGDPCTNFLDCLVPTWLSSCWIIAGLSGCSRTRVRVVTWTIY